MKNDAVLPNSPKFKEFKGYDNKFQICDACVKDVPYNTGFRLDVRSNSDKIINPNFCETHFMEFLATRPQIKELYDGWCNKPGNKIIDGLDTGCSECHGNTDYSVLVWHASKNIIVFRWCRNCVGNLVAKHPRVKAMWDTYVKKTHK